MSVLYGAAVVLRPIVPDDIPRLGTLMADPKVAPWLPRDSTPATAGFAVDLDGRLVGLAQYHEDPSRDYRHASLEVILDPAWHGKGLGADALRALARHLFYDRRHHRLVIELDPRNTKALCSYQRVGFKRVGVLRECELDTVNGWRDAILLDLLKRDLQ